MLRRRVPTALVLTSLAVGAVWFGEPWLTVLVAVLGLLATLEFYRLGGYSGRRPLTYFGLVFTLLLIVGRNPDLLARLETLRDPSLLMPSLLTAATALSLIWIVWRRENTGAFADWAWTVGGILYIGWLFSHMVSLRGLADGRNWVFLALLATFASDSAAFFVGRSVGRHRLAPRISPKKTWEGAIAGVFGAVLLSFVFAQPTVFDQTNPLHIAALSYWQAALLGGLVSIFGQFGDLAESLLKRNAATKDSSGLLPGHGGVLDRLDSVLFAGIVVYYYVGWVTP